MKLSPALLSHIRNLAVDAEELVDMSWRRLTDRLGIPAPRHCAAYRGYVDVDTAYVMGRVLADPPLGGPEEDERWWDNLLNTYRRFESDELPDREVLMHVDGQTLTSRTDEEGYYRFEVPMTVNTETRWIGAIAEVPRARDVNVTARHELLVPSSRANFGVISDLDDTVLKSDITSLLTAAKLVFLHNARTRKPLDGVAMLYQALEQGTATEAINPIFYVSSSPWNLYDLLIDFMDMNAIPKGPVFLRDIGLNREASRGHRHKLDKAVKIMERFPDLPFILMGDSGQQDAELYAHAAERYGDRILSIYIRDVDPNFDSSRDESVDRWIEKAADYGVPMRRIQKSHDALEHAVANGWVSSRWIQPVATEERRDEIRPTLTEAATDEIQS